MPRLLALAALVAAASAFAPSGFAGARVAAPSLAPPPPRDRRGGPRRRLPSSASSKWEGDVVRAARERHRASAAPRAEARHLSHELERALGADLAEAWPAGLALAVHA